MDRRLTILIADDDPVFLKLLPAELALHGFSISTATGGKAVLDVLLKKDFDVVVLDVDLPDISGLEVLERIRMEPGSPEVIMVTADKSLETGLEAMRAGAYDYITKPADAGELSEVIKKAAEKTGLYNENARLLAAAGGVATQNQPVFESPAMKRIFAEAGQIAEVDATILITGESGTGKDVLANWIHSRSSRSARPLVSVNCGAIPENLAESEFFGFEKGAFTGAASQKVGLIEAAHSSTLFLDEVGEMPQSLQVKLLRFLENGVFRRVGSVKDKSSDVRVLAATNRRLQDGIDEGRFRSDLFYRLNVINFEIPPLRDRKEDILLLASVFLERSKAKFGRPNMSFSHNARGRLLAYEWPGNVRELKNVIERNVALARGDTIEEIQGIFDQTPVPKTENRKTSEEIVPLAEIEKDHILKTLESLGGNREKAAVVLGISVRTLYRKLKSYGA
ncbi:MAG: sigma-54 dependent transcriptional regulator [Pyrinomonadaceae bacterium]